MPERAHACAIVRQKSLKELFGGSSKQRQVTLHAAGDVQHDNEANRLRSVVKQRDRLDFTLVANLEILLGTLLRPLHRKTRLPAFDALANAARGDAEAARRVLERARLALCLPDKKYPKEQLVGLIGRVLHARPELRRPSERPKVYGLQAPVEVTA